MKIYIQIITLGLMMLLSAATANAAKANHDRNEVHTTKSADKSIKAKNKSKDGGGEHEVSWGTNAVKAIDHNGSRSNTTATKIQPAPTPKGDGKDKKKKQKKK